MGFELLHRQVPLFLPLSEGFISSCHSVYFTIPQTSVTYQQQTKSTSQQYKRRTRASRINIMTSNTISAPLLAIGMDPTSTSKLDMTRTEFRDSHFSNTGKPYDKIVIGAIVFTDNRILLLKRAAHETYYPNVFELPSGNVDETDPTLGHALAREVEEETGLDVTFVLSELLPPFEYETSKIVGGVQVSRSCVQVNFVVEMEGDEIVVNPEEHSVGIWAGADELEGLEITEGMRGLVRKAFDDQKARSQGTNGGGARLNFRQLQ
jgi:8-oxo-dGTP pyrophosphatase MutT (NUDIX family)